MGKTKSGTWATSVNAELSKSVNGDRNLRIVFPLSVWLGWYRSQIAFASYGPIHDTLLATLPKYWFLHAGAVHKLFITQRGKRLRDGYALHFTIRHRLNA
jgi:hypothetical protein